MKETQIPPVHTTNLVANSGNTAYGAESIVLTHWTVDKILFMVLWFLNILCSKVIILCPDCTWFNGKIWHILQFHGLVTSVPMTKHINHLGFILLLGHILACGSVILKWSGFTQLPNQLTINQLRPDQNGQHFADNIFKWIFLNENYCIFMQILRNFAPKGPIDKCSASGQVMAQHQTGDKPLSEPMKIQFMDTCMHHQASMG